MGAQGVYYIVFDLAQVHYKVASSQSLSDNKQTDVVTVPLKVFSERPDEHEIWIDGALYDIGAYRVSGNDVRITVFHDKGEEALLHGIAAIFESSDTHYCDFHGNHISRAHSNGFNGGKILFANYNGIQTISSFIANDITDHLCFCFPVVYSGILKPPPRVVFAC